jgi:hypothetical protein
LTPAERDQLYGHGLEIGRARKNVLQWFRVALKVYEGREIIDLRLHAINQNGELYPMRAGVTIPLAMIPEVMRLLTEAKAEAERLGWIAAPVYDGPANAVGPTHDQFARPSPDAGDASGGG